jgi:ABC-type antimicrobial peptide transport system permease subunit
MLRNYFTIAFRYLTKNKVSSFINIAGLSIGMTVAMLIGLWIYNELTYNTWHRNYDRIAEVYSNANYSGTIYTINSHPMPLGAELRSSFGQDFKHVVLSTPTGQILSRGDKKFSENGRYMEAGAPDLLSLHMLSGKRSGLTEIHSILISAALAKKLFDEGDPVNQVVQIDNQFSAKVTGVFENLPDNSDFKGIEFILPLDFYISRYDWARKKTTDWSDMHVQIYVELNPNISCEKASEHIKTVLASHAIGNLVLRKPVLFLQPMRDWHLYSTFENGVRVTSGQLKLIRFYTIIGSFVLLLACINFMNLSTARSEKRAKEVGIRKAIGSGRGQLISQFFSESLLISFFSFFLAIAFVQLSLPWFNHVSGKEISIPWKIPGFWLACFCFMFLTGILAGIYPALYLSSFKPVRVLKGVFKTGPQASVPRKALVVLQFSVSIALIIGTIIVYQQLQFAKNRPVGYHRESLLQIPINSPEFDHNYQLFADEIKNTGVVNEVAASASPLTSIWSTNSGFSWGRKNNVSEIEFSTINITQEYGKTVGWQFLEGRDFTKGITSDSMGFVINEAAAKIIGLKNPVGETIDWTRIKDKRFKILGVIKNMIMESPFAEVPPTIYFIYQRDGINYTFLQLNPRVNAALALEKIETTFKKINPATVFDYSFVSDEFNKKFAAEEQIGTLSRFFAGLAILISCLGLFGLASFVAEQRTKEIGIRKVLGASVINVWKLLSKEFVLLVMMSFIIAAPVAWYFMHNWLQNYSYRTGISFWVFLTAGTAALLVTLLTISFQAIKAAVSNPVDSLRAE